MPTSAIAVDGDRIDALAGLRAGRADLDGVAGQVGEPPGGHLRAAGVVDADEQDAGRPLTGDLRGGAMTRGPAMRAAAGATGRPATTPSAPPTNCCAMKAATDAGAMPANVSREHAATVTAGFANDVELVNQ